MGTGSMVGVRIWVGSRSSVVGSYGSVVGNPGQAAVGQAAGIRTLPGSRDPTPSLAA